MLMIGSTSLFPDLMRIRIRSRLRIGFRFHLFLLTFDVMFFFFVSPLCFVIVPTCGPPQLPPNSELWRSQSGKTSYNYKERVAIKCKSGYFIRGFGYKTCDSSGWTGPKFSCSRKLHYTVKLK